MEKLQALLTLHKDKLWGGGIDFKIWTREIENHSKQIMITHHYHIYQGRSEVQYTLSDLLFNTPFLSWLEWKEDGTYMKSGWMGSNDLFIRSDTNTSEYHKINLVLLDTDEARIQYLEDNLL